MPHASTICDENIAFANKRDFAMLLDEGNRI